MRKDMFKVVVERERRSNTENKFHDVRGRVKANAEDAPKMQGMRRPHRWRKQLNENLAPLKNFLNKSVGKKWDLVYKEISEHLSPSNAVKQHVKDHVYDFVHRHIVVDRHGRSWTMRYWQRLLKRGDLYIDGKGFLRKFKGQPEWKPKKGDKLYYLVQRVDKNRSKNSIRLFIYHEVIPKDDYIKYADDVIVSEFWAGSVQEANKYLKPGYTTWKSIDG